MKILLAGDSWGCGEWNIDWKKGCNHRGLEQYLKDDKHDVKNISEGGFSFYNILEKLNYENEKHDYVFIFVTDAHRDVVYNKFWVKNYTYEDYLFRWDINIKAFVESLDTLNIGPIFLLGGLTKCYNKYVKDTKIKIAIPSIFELIVPESKHYDMCFHDNYDTLNTKNINKETLGKVYEQTQILDNLLSNPIFHPDGQHPNREGHYLIYKFLKDKYLHVTDN
tara:strand:- start:2186 stop:2851 length:666 start_codon:yes stop_codon:yes gene_type:complete